MTADLFWLVCTGVLSLFVPLLYLTGRAQTPGGIAWAFGNRDSAFQIPAWAERAQRAHANLTENLAPFAILVLAAHLSGNTGHLTTLGAAIFFWARLAHVLVYTAGIVGVRTLVFFIGTLGEILILVGLFG